MIISEETVYWIKYILYATSFVWVLYLVVFFHELGHAIAVVSLGGTVVEFVVAWDLSGHVKWTFGDIPMTSYPIVCTLVSVSGGIGAALFFMVLSHKSKWFCIPVLLSLVDGFGEALYQADTRFYAINGVGLSVLFICLMLFWQFGERENEKLKEKRLARAGPRERRVPEHIYEKAMRALEKCVGVLEEKPDRLRDLEEETNED